MTEQQVYCLLDLGYRFLNPTTDTIYSIEPDGYRCHAEERWPNTEPISQYWFQTALSANYDILKPYQPKRN